MAGKSNLAATLFAQKKLLNKSHTSILKSDAQETIGTNIQPAAATTFGQKIPTSPARTLYLLQSASNGLPTTIEYVQFNLESISGTSYDADAIDSGAGGGASTVGPHAYKLILTGNYQALSSNPKKGNGIFDNSKTMYTTIGGLQVIPPVFSNDSPNPYTIKLYKGDPTDNTQEIPLEDEIDWQLDTFSGILFVQDYDSSNVPLFARGFIYVGDMVDTVISNGGGGGGSGDANAEYVLTAATGSLSNAKIIEAGTGISIITGSNSVTISSAFAAINGRTKKSYFVTSSHGALSSLTVPGINFNVVNYEPSKIDVLFNGQLQHSGTLAQVKARDRDYVIDTTSSIKFGFNLQNDDIVDSVISVLGSPGGGSAGDIYASYIVLSATGSLNAERVLTAGTGISLVDGGPGNPLTINSTGGGFFSSPLPSFLNTTGSISLAGGLGVNHTSSVIGSDTFFFVSGTIGSKGSATRGTTVIGGDLVVSGAIVGLNTITGSINRSKRSYFLPSNQAAHVAVTVPQADFSKAQYDSEYIDIHVNGLLLHSGSQTQVNQAERDYYITSTNSLKFAFDLKIDDIIDVVVFNIR